MTQSECSECGGLGDQSKAVTHANDCSLKPAPRAVRRASFTVPWKKFDGTDKAKVTIEENRGTGRVLMIIRPHHRRRVVEVDLGEIAQGVVARVIKAEVIAARKNKKKKRI